jgi:hypothetical protein
MDVHPPKNGINRYWSIPISILNSILHFLCELSPFSAALLKAACHGEGNGFHQDLAGSTGDRERSPLVMTWLTGLAMVIFHGPNRNRWAIPFWTKMGGYLTMANWQCHNQRVRFWTANFNSSTGLCTSSTWNGLQHWFRCQQCSKDAANLPRYLAQHPTISPWTAN